MIILKDYQEKAVGSLLRKFDNLLQSSENEVCVLKAPTGSGKTQGTIVYCKMLSRLDRRDHPGVLIVTRRIDDANQIAEQINKLSGKTDEAVAYHSDNKINLERLPSFPVLVICHRAYEQAMDAMTEEGAKIQHTWPHFYSWQHWTDRKLVIIDEALDIVEHSQAGLDGLNQTLGEIPHVMQEKHLEAVKAIKETTAQLAWLDNRNDKKEPVRDHMVLDKILKEGEIPDLDALRKDMRTIKYDKQLGKNDALERQRLMMRHDQRIKNLNNIFRSWRYYASYESKPTFNTARLLVPDKVKGAVVLDATASSDLIYKLFDQAVLIKPPPLQEDEKLKITPLAFIRGRSLSNIIFIVDEAQNLTPHEVKTIITRAGENTKIISVPSFLKTKKFIILDLQTLDTYDYKIDVSSLLEMQVEEDSEKDELEFE